MGAYTSTHLAPDEIQEFERTTNFSSREIAALYHRFKKVDRNRVGYISHADFHLIPELSMNPLVQRIIALFDPSHSNEVTFNQFVTTLNYFHKNTPKDTKLMFVFQVYDVDGDGLISEADLFQLLKSLVGSNISDSILQILVHKTMQSTMGSSHAGLANKHSGNNCEEISTGIGYEEFAKIMGDSADSLVVNIPIGD